ncbi:MAG TPA: YceD family protein [Hydrogenophaga sp.]|uniref:YceD family protein n=1 Tax=Hydrogenophaga sp. TaxID=1904254 RepID=UPI002C5A3FCE|nr:YceD family protein [Hydrogenophaga sp.]HMN94292.1 YceD family protein [Hydrogenophaga sp.]HMP10029.1 YceD family protein [Hydrogenophaga sp.]
MKAKAPSSWNAERIDMRAFAQAGGHLSAQEPVEAFARLAAERHPDGTSAGPLQWAAQAEMRPGLPGAEPTPWLHLQAEVTLDLTCQRCLGPAPVRLLVDRWFRFVADEATAEREDEDSEEDVLALEPRPSLRALVEDECLMELPLVPMHEVCPTPVSLSAGEVPDAAPERENPFARLQRLRQGD